MIKIQSIELQSQKIDELDKFLPDNNRTALIQKKLKLIMQDICNNNSIDEHALNNKLTSINLLIFQLSQEFPNKKLKELKDEIFKIAAQRS